MKNLIEKLTDPEGALERATLAVLEQWQTDWYSNSIAAEFLES